MPNRKEEGVEVEIGGIVLEALQGDIAAQTDIDAVVNAANAQLLPGGGVAGAIHRAAGPGLAEECRPLSPIKPGEAVITSAHRLSNRFVIHCLGPVYGRDKPEEELLASCYRNALLLADEKGLTSVAFPAISTGIFGYPLKEAARVALRAVKKTLPELKSIKRVRFVLYSASDLGVFEEVISSTV